MNLAHLSLSRKEDADAAQAVQNALGHSRVSQSCVGSWQSLAPHVDRTAPYSAWTIPKATISAPAPTHTRSTRHLALHKEILDLTRFEGRRYWKHCRLLFHFCENHEPVARFEGFSHPLIDLFIDRIDRAGGSDAEGGTESPFAQRGVGTISSEWLHGTDAACFEPTIRRSPAARTKAFRALCSLRTIRSKCRSAGITLM